MIRTLLLKSATAAMLLTFFGIASQAESVNNATARPAKSIAIWENGVPGALGNDSVKDVPTITPFWAKPELATGASIVICPGGGYGGLAGHEGKDYALWLNDRGVTAFVLKYRLGSNGYRHPAMMNDVLRAIRVVRSNAAQWQLKSDKIGVMGSSAGGHLASTAVTHFDSGNAQAVDPVDRISSRPDLGILCYPVISMGKYTHGGSKNNLLGENPPDGLVEFLSNELQVTKNTPPCFLWHTRDDRVVNVRNSLMFADALLAVGVPYDLHIYQTGPHGMGLGVRNYDPEKSDMSKLLPWTNDLACWLKLQGFAK